MLNFNFINKTRSGTKFQNSKEYRDWWQYYTFSGSWSPTSSAANISQKERYLYYQSHNSIKFKIYIDEFSVRFFFWKESNFSVSTTQLEIIFKEQIKGMWMDLISVPQTFTFSRQALLSCLFPTTTRRGRFLGRIFFWFLRESFSYRTLHISSICVLTV